MVKKITEPKIVRATVRKKSDPAPVEGQIKIRTEYMRMREALSRETHWGNFLHLLWQIMREPQFTVYKLRKVKKGEVQPTEPTWVKVKATDRFSWRPDDTLWNLSLPIQGALQNLLIENQNRLWLDDTRRESHSPAVLMSTVEEDSYQVGDDIRMRRVLVFYPLLKETFTIDP